ncbi:DUF2471 family protein [Glaciimonas sp. PCH181]|uniref:DUF2471 family protein n=1 Tax=Glaciimonas sp. PCH181 TaxID=2133943 RepID=UPI000D35976B|nr:DUF2471 family protein [Glaciimonas sp. PCH181]PUA19510.1 hypothetical protein C7W93_06530 [Glaciimonas sp. PCH181]
MEFLEMSEFDAVVARLELVIEPIVARHRGEGDKLTWRLMQMIEREAISELQREGHLNPVYISMVRPSPVFSYPETDALVNFGESNAIACSYAMIYEAYSRLH